MKKIFGTLAMALCLTAMVSCGGDKKGEDVVAKAKEYQQKLNHAAYEERDRGKAREIMAEYEAWIESLSEADQEKIAKAMRGE